MLTKEQKDALRRIDLVSDHFERETDPVGYYDKKIQEAKSRVKTQPKPVRKKDRITAAEYRNMSLTERTALLREDPETYRKLTEAERTAAERQTYHD